MSLIARKYANLLSEEKLSKGGDDKEASHLADVRRPFRLFRAFTNWETVADHAVQCRAIPEARMTSFLAGSEVNSTHATFALQSRITIAHMQPCALAHTWTSSESVLAFSRDSSSFPSASFSSVVASSWASAGEFPAPRLPVGSTTSNRQSIYCADEKAPYEMRRRHLS